MKRPALIALVVAAVLVAFVGSFLAFRAKGLPRHGELLAIGDSIAAGAGLGPAEGYPDNILAYPAALADSLGWSGFDLAIEGACSLKATDPGADPETRKDCNRSVFSDELARVGSILPRAPDVIVMTVGGNDIDFANCGLELIASFLIHQHACNGPVFEQRVAALSANLSTLLGKVRGMFPHARVYVTSYFNPLPAASDVSACAIYDLVAAVRSPLAVLLNRGGSAAIRAQADLYQRAQSIVDALDQAIRDAVRKAKDHFVGLDFSGHDFCQSNVSNAWVFGPEVHVSLRAAGISKRWDYLLPYYCPNNSGRGAPISTHGPVTARLAGIVVSYNAILSNNCMPHPTRQGQQAIAQAIASALRR